jgi:rod shape-determining protein MreC
VVVGYLYNNLTSIKNYFNLIEENKKLIEENQFLRLRIINTKSDTISNPINYNITNGNVIKNSYNLTKNYITLDIGRNQGVEVDFGVISSNGVIGIVDKISSNYSRVISILNTNINLNAKLKTSNHFGTLSWNGVSPSYVQLKDLPKQAVLKIGDTITTGGNSLIFPKGILIGSIKSHKLDNSQNYLELEVKLFNDMSNINHVYIIENKKINEIRSLDE